MKSVQFFNLLMAALQLQGQPLRVLDYAENLSTADLATVARVLRHFADHMAQDAETEKAAATMYRWLDKC